MEKVIPEMDSKTMDIVAGNVNKLKELFPEAFTEGKVDFEALKDAREYFSITPLIQAITAISSFSNLACSASF